jgi:hypothetical protein
MQIREKSGQTLVEPVTIDEFKTYIGYSESDQDEIISDLLTACRVWVENYSGKSMIEKTYQVSYSIFDEIQSGWYGIPIAPVDSITSVELAGTAASYDKKHFDEQVKPIGIFDDMEIEYIAGVHNQFPALKSAVYRIAANMFTNKRDTTTDNELKVDFTTKKLLNSLP